MVLAYPSSVGNEFLLMALAEIRYWLASPTLATGLEKKKGNHNTMSATDLGMKLGLLAFRSIWRGVGSTFSLLVILEGELLGLAESVCRGWG